MLREIHVTSWLYRLVTIFVSTCEIHAQDVIRPTALQPGDTIMFVAPAGPLEEARIELARKRLEAKGLRVKLPHDLYRKNGFLAGTDDQRAQELMQAFLDHEVRGIFPGTGGYGTMRILDRLDYQQIQRNPKIFIGFSDITALHTAIHQRTGLITFHSPNPMWGLGSEEGLSSYSDHYFWRAIWQRGPNLLSDDHDDVISPAAWSPEQTATRLQEVCHLPMPRALSPGIARGHLIGGNLSLIAALMGTPFEVQTKDKILFLEDVGEAPYRVDRMLQTLQLAGKLNDVAGVILGTFTRREDEDASNEVGNIEDVLTGYFAGRPYPVLLGFPVGHHVCNATLPIGGVAELDAHAGSLRLLESPTVSPAEPPRQTR